MPGVLDFSVSHVSSVSYTELLTVSEAKQRLRIDIDVEDVSLESQIKRARIKVEHDTRRSLVSHTYDFSYDCFPGERLIRFAGYTPLQSVTYLKYYDVDGTLQTWAAANYEVDTARDTIWLAYETDWPALRNIQNAVKIRSVFGHVTSDEECELAKQAALLLVGHWHENREAVLIGSISKEIELSYLSLIETLAKRSYP